MMSHNPTRTLIAQLAARLMQEHGIRDFAQAKRKAAKQLGIVEAHHLPANAEIDQAIREYNAVYHSDTQPGLLRELRLAALEAMEMLHQFAPQLTGAVLNGTAGPHSDIQLELFTDSEKDVEMYLLNRKLPFRQAQCIATSGAQGRRAIPCFILEGISCDIRITVYPPDALRRSSRPDGLRRVSVSQLKTLMAQDENPVVTTSPD